MLSIRYGGEPPEVELAATAAEFGRLASRIADLVASDAAETFVEATASCPELYDRCLSGLRIAKGATPLSVEVAGSVLCVSGDPTALVLLARNLPVESSLPAGYHVHFEATGREHETSPNSTPLVLCVAGDPAA